MFATISFHLQASSVIIFNGLNFFEWSQQIKFHLGVLVLDLSLWEEKPVVTNNNTKEEMSKLKAWKQSNRLSIMFMQMTIANNIKIVIPQVEHAREYLKFVEECFYFVDKSLTSILIAQLTTMKFDRSRSMQEHTIEMTNIVARLMALGMIMDNSFMVQFILNPLPFECGTF